MAKKVTPCRSQKTNENIENCFEEFECAIFSSTFIHLTYSYKSSRSLTAQNFKIIVKFEIFSEPINFRAPKYQQHVNRHKNDHYLYKANIQNRCLENFLFIFTQTPCYA